MSSQVPEPESKATSKQTSKPTDPGADDAASTREAAATGDTVAAGDPAAGDPAASDDAAAPRHVTVRRAPKFVPFLLLGALLGLIAAVIVTFITPADGDFSRGTLLGFFAMVLMIPGVLLGAIAALVLDQLSVRRSERLSMRALADEPSEDPHANPPEG